MKEITLEELSVMPKDSYVLIDIRDIFNSMENVDLGAVLGYKKDGIRHSFLEEY